MNHSTNAPLHLCKLLRLLGILDESAISNDLSIHPVVLHESVVAPLEPYPGLFRHCCIKGLAKLQANLLDNTFFRQKLLEGIEMGHLVFDELECTF